MLKINLTEILLYTFFLSVYQLQCRAGVTRNQKGHTRKSPAEKGKKTKSVLRTSAAETNISGFYFIAQPRGRAYFLIYISLIFI